MVMVELDVDTFVTRKSPQFIASCAAGMGAFALGTAVAWTSPAMPDMERSGDYGHLSIDEKTWVAAIMTLGGLISGPFAGAAMSRLGRRGALMYLSLPCVLAWLLIALGTNVNILYLGRFLLGFCIGAYTIVVNVYIAEIAEDKIRGTLGFLFPILVSSGVLYTYVMGAFLSWKLLTFSNIAFPLVMLGGMYMVPESPIHLLNQGKKKLAGKCLQWFRGADSFDQIENELQQMQHFVEDNAGKKVTFKDFLVPSVVKPTLISFGLLFFQQLSGVNVILFYTVEIFRSTGSEIDPNIATIIVGVVVVLSCIISTPFIDRMGRRMLLLMSAAGMCLSLGAMGVFFYLKELNENKIPENLGWLPLASLMCYILSLNWGYGPIPWVMLGELIPTHVKGGASAIVTSLNWFMCFLMIKTFEDLAVQLGMYGVYWFFSAFCFVGIFFAYFIVPETRGKTLEDIEKLFK